MRIQGCLTNNSDLWQTPAKLYHWFIDKGWFDPCPVNPQFNDGKFVAPFPSMLVTIPAYTKSRTNIYLLPKENRFWEDENTTNKQD